jgi:HK97 family phage major capsid protein
MTLAELRRLRAQKHTEGRTLVNNAETRDLTDDEKTKVTSLQTEIRSIESRIEQLESFQSPPGPGGSVSDPLDQRDAPNGNGGSGQLRRFSLMKCIRALAGLEVLSGLELEVHQELSKRKNEAAADFRTSGAGVPVAAVKGICIPHRSGGLYRDAGDILDETRAMQAVLRSRANLAEYRDLTTSTGSGSIAAILGTDFIDILRNRMLMAQLKARVMSGMTGGSFSLPKKTVKGTTYWVTEGTAPTNTNITIGQVTFNPKTVGAVTDLSRKFMLQTSLDAEGIARDDLLSDLAHEIDRVGFNGSGSGAEPLGIMQDGAITVVAIGTNGGAPTWDKIVELETQVSLANADADTMAYVTGSQGRGILKRTLRSTVANSKYIWDDLNTVNSYGAYASNSIPANLSKGSASGTLTSLLFGNFASLTYALWGGLDLIEDPYTKSNVGGLRLVALQDLDVQKRYTQSFAVCNDMTY